MIRQLPLLFALLAQAAATQTRPSDGPDLSSPERAVLAFMRAALEGDATAMRRPFLPGKAPERTITVQAAFTNSLRDLDRAADKAFGPGESLALLPNPDQVAQVQIPEIWVKVEGDRATVTLTGEEPPHFELRRVEGQWRLASMREDKQVLAWMERMSKAADDVTRRIQEGRYADRTAAEAAWGAAQPGAEEFFGPPSTTTQPTTSPAVAPRP